VLQPLGWRFIGCAIHHERDLLSFERIVETTAWSH